MEIMAVFLSTTCQSCAIYTSLAPAHGLGRMGGGRFPPPTSRWHRPDEAYILLKIGKLSTGTLPRGLLKSFVSLPLRSFAGRALHLNQNQDNVCLFYDLSHFRACAAYHYIRAG